MIANTPPVVLVYAPLDPTGTQYLPADTLSCAALGCHALSVVTATHIQDTLHTERIVLSAPDLMYEQMRCLLEDIRVHSIKAGPLYCIDSVSVLAQIVADYTELPLIVHLQSIPHQELLTDDIEVADTLEALFQLVLPQCDIAVADQTLLAQWQSDGLLPEHTDPVVSLLELGTQWVLHSSYSPHQAGISYQLHNQSGLQQQWHQPANRGQAHDTEALLSTAISAYLAQQHSVPQACAMAIDYTSRVSSRIFQAGMGTPIINPALVYPSALL